MKTKLLCLLLISSVSVFAQSPINTFYIDDADAFAVVTSNTPIDHSASGANLNWNFNQLVSVGDSNYFTLAPTASEITQFPNSNHVINSVATSNQVTSTSKLFVKDVANTISITGLQATDLELNFSTNNATLGAFPMNYGFSNTDPLAGTYTYGTYSGTFTGNIVTAVDAYGTLTTNVGGGNNLPVTRLKTIITINLNYGFITNVGTITQTTYSYYTSTNMEFRSATTTALVPLASINQTDTVMESYMGSLGIETSHLQANQADILPNPVSNRLNFYAYASDNLIPLSYTIIDSNGRVVLKRETEEASIDVSLLEKGIYIAKIATNKGTVTKKIIKE